MAHKKKIYSKVKPLRVKQSTSLKKSLQNRKRRKRVHEYPKCFLKSTPSVSRIDLNLLIDNTSDGIFLLDVSLRHTFVNRSMESFADLSREELLGSRIDDLTSLPEDVRAQMKEACEYVIEKGRANHLIISRPTERGTLYCETRLVPERDHCGKVVGIVGIIRNITESRYADDEALRCEKKPEVATYNSKHFENFIVSRTEEKGEIEAGHDHLLRKKNRLEEILQALPIGLALFDRNGTLVYWNDRAVELWGQVPRERSGSLKYVQELFLSTIEGKLYDPLELPSSRALFKGERVWGEEVTINRPDGNKIIVLANAAPLSESNEIGGAVLAFMDVTEIKHAQELSQKLDVINLQLLSNADIDLKLQYAVNEGATSLKADFAALSFLRKPNEWVARKVYGFSDDFIGDSVTDIEKRHAMLAIQTGQSVVIEDTSKEEWADVIHFKKHGIRSVIVIPINGKDRPIGVISFSYCSPKKFILAETDFCANLAASISFSVQNTKLLNDVKVHAFNLELANRDLEAFSHSISHDLRAPLIVIDGFAQRLMDKVELTPSARGLTYIKNIRESCRHGMNLVNDLLNLFKAGREQIKREKIDVSMILSTISKRIQTISAERKVHISIQGGLKATGDRRLMTIALQNLFENAWKFTSYVENPMIEFGLDTSGETPAFFLRDNGCGFDKDHAETIFTPFHSAHSRDEYPGTGLGLATVHRIISSHGGRIWAESEPGRGATFYFALPFPP